MTCSTCAEAGRRGYCAPLRCYCGHGTCPAFDSFVPLARLNLIPLKSRLAKPVDKPKGC